MTYQSGSAISYYILDISDAERKAAQLRSIYQGIRQDAASLSTPVVQQSTSGNTQAVTAAIQAQATVTKTAQTATQALIASTIELGAAQGLTTDEINNQLAAMSREALAAGDLAAANELIDASLGTIAASEQAVVTVRQASVRTIEQEANEELRLAQTQARTLAASGNQVGALNLLTNARQNATNASKQSLAVADTQIAGLQKSASVTGAFSAQMQSLVNPVVLVTAAVGASVAVFHSFGEALHFKADLDEINASNALLLRGTRNVSQAFDEATQFANTYKLTEKETSDAISESIPVIRNSASSLDEVLSVFTRLTILKPGKTFNDASRALGELQAGNVVSLERIFNILPDDARRMKEEIDGGADAVQVLSKYLTNAGVGTEALELRAKGAQGAFRDAAIAAENVKKAQGEIAASSGGIDLVNLYAQFQTGVARALGGAGGLTEGLKQLDAQAAGNRAGQDAYNQALADGKTKTEALAIAQRTAAITASNFAYGQDAITKKTYDQVAAFDEDRIAIGKLQIAMGNLKELGAQAKQFSADLTPELLEKSTGLSLAGTVAYQNTQIQNAKDLTAAQLSYAQATNNVAEQRRILNQQLKDAHGDTIAELNIKGQIAQLDQQSAKGTTKGLSGLDRSEITLAGNLQQQLDEVNHRLESGKLTQLQRNQLLIDQGKLQDKINDAVQKERDLQTSIALDQVHNDQQNIEDARELDGLRRAEKDSRFDATQQQAIRLREQEILLQQQKRANDLAKEQTQLNDTVKDSGIGAAQAVNTAAQSNIPVSQVPPIGSGIPVTSQGVPQVQLANGEKLTINLTVNVDQNGKITAEKFDPSVALNLIAHTLGVQASSGGFP